MVELKKLKKSELIAKLSDNREAWLQNCAEGLAPALEEVVGKDMPNFRISVGFPSRNGLSMRKRVIGQCWNKMVCINGSVHHIFISPLLGDPITVTATVAHELAHAIVGVEHGHKKPFTDAIRPIGLIGKPTATQPNENFIKAVTPLLDKLGKYPHGGMAVNPNYKAAQGRLIKVQCAHEGCQFKARITRVWLDNEKYGAPICPLHNEAMVEEGMLSRAIKLVGV